MTFIDRDLDLLDHHVGMFNYRNLRRVDPALMSLTLVLAAVGIAVLYSASFGTTQVSNPHWKQLVRLVVGMIAVLLFVCIDYRVLLSLAPVAFVACIGMLVAVLFFGEEAKGGQHWLPLGPIRVQPSEFSKIGLVFMLAWYLARAKQRVRRFHYFVGAFVIWGGVIGLILIQGDLGTAIVAGPIVFTMLFVAGCKRRHLALIVSGGLAALPVAYSMISDRQRKLITVFLHPEQANRDDIYQALQSRITVGSGQLWGKGFGESTQTQLSYLPDFHTDFVFALWAEEFGFVGGAAVVILFALLLLRGLQLASDCPALSGSLLAVGALTILASHAFVNIAIVLNLLPVTGLPLPFLSYGGSFYLTVMICIGTILSAHIKRNFFER